MSINHLMTELNEWTSEVGNREPEDVIIYINGNVQFAIYMVRSTESVHGFSYHTLYMNI